MNVWSSTISRSCLIRPPVMACASNRRDLPRELRAFANDRVARRKVDADIVIGRVQRTEVILNDLLLVADRDDEIVKSATRVQVHQVPEDRSATDFHHGFATRPGFFRESRSEPACEDDDFQQFTRARWPAHVRTIRRASCARCRRSAILGLSVSTDRRCSVYRRPDRLS